MPARAPLSDDRIAAALEGLDGWAREGDRIAKTYRFANFREAVAFIVRVAFVCEARDHHPELTNVYDRVTLAFNTHDADGKVTETDLALAQEIEAMATGS
jgi:4a-hydroxytetrahydrobiopterin dehydratase